MAISVSTNFNVGTRLPIDNRTVVADTNALGEIVSPYEGMIVYLTDEGKFVYYRGGIYADLASGGTSSDIGSYTWYIDTDDVQNKDGESVGTLSACMTDDYVGTWFYVRTTSSEAGSAAYDSDTYTIDGANGYLSLRDYVIWTGAHLVHVSTYEAKASTTKNSDGKYSPKSGVDGLMSSTDKAYLTDLIDKYWGCERVDLACTTEEHYANNCVHGGFYSPITLGRPTDIDDTDTKETLGLIVIPDNKNNQLIQIAYSQKRDGYVWTRICTDKNNKTFSSWVRILPIADGSITTDKLDSTLKTAISTISSLETRLSALESEVASLSDATAAASDSDVEEVLTETLGE